MKITSFVVRLLAGLVYGAALCACGGGSGGASGSAGAPNPTGGSAILTPSRADLTTYEGEQVDFSFTATTNKTSGTPIKMAVGEKADVTSPVYDVTAVSPGVFRADMHTGFLLHAGVHETSLEVRLCEDSPAQCKLPVAGSPLFYPVKVTVKSKAEGAARVTVSPAMDLTAVYRKSQEFTVNVNAVAPFGRQVFAGVFDPSRRISSVSPIEPSFVQDYSARMVVDFDLGVGTYDVKLEVRLCMDDPAICRFPMAGSPWIVPVRLTVKA